MRQDAHVNVGRNWIQFSMIFIAIIGLLFMGACTKKIRSDYPSLKRSGDQATGGSGSQSTGQGDGAGCFR